MDAIITAAIGYAESELQLFLESIKRNCNGTKVFLIVLKQDGGKISRLQNKYSFIEPVYVPKKYVKQKLLTFHVWIAHFLSRVSYLDTNSFLKKIERYLLHIVIKRFFIALDIVRNHRNSLTSVMLTDCRDVFIQKNPFELIDQHLISGLEPKKIKDEPLTSRWIANIYGEDILSRFSDKRVVCAGVTLGPVGEVEKYLTRMCSEIWKYLPQVTELKWGSDQGIHNYLIYEKEILCDLTDNQEGLIATLSLEDPSSLFKDTCSGLIQVDGNYPNIVHQYDRHPDLVNFLKQQFLPSDQLFA